MYCSSTPKRTSREINTCLGRKNARWDLLSFCPSLVSILSLVDAEDVSRCKLVNRRIFGVIKRNHYAMPRKFISISISSAFDVQSQDVYVIVNVGTFDHTVSDVNFDTVTNKMTNMSIHVHSNRVNVVFGLSHRFYTMFKEPIDGIRIDSISAGLRLALDPLFHSVYLHYLKLIDDIDSFRPEWYQSISDAFLSNRCRCGVLRAPKWHNFSKSHPRTSELIIDWSSNVRNGLPKLAHINWITAYVSLTDEVQEELKGLFKDWYTGRWRLSEVMMIIKGNKNCSAVLDKMISSLVLVFGEGCTWRVDRGRTSWSYFFRRPSDDVVLCLGYCDFVANHLLCYDILSEINDISFIYERFL